MQVFLGMISEETLISRLILAQKVMGGHINPTPCPKMFMPGTSEYVKLRGQRDFADIIEVVDFKMGKSSWTIPGGLSVIT